MVVDGQILHRPKSIIDREVVQWHKLWSAGVQFDGPGLFRVSGEVRSQADVEGLPPLTGPMLQAAAHAMRPRAGQGAGRLGLLDIERLPPEGLDDLALLLNNIERNLSWPRQ